MSEEAIHIAECYELLDALYQYALAMAARGRGDGTAEERIDEMLFALDEIQTHGLWRLGPMRHQLPELFRAELNLFIAAYQRMREDILKFTHPKNCYRQMKAAGLGREELLDVYRIIVRAEPETRLLRLCQVVLNFKQDVRNVTPFRDVALRLKAGAIELLAGPRVKDQREFDNFAQSGVPQIRTIERDTLHETALAIGDFIHNANNRGERPKAQKIANELGCAPQTVYKHMSETLADVGFTNPRKGGYVAPPTWPRSVGPM